VVVWIFWSDSTAVPRPVDLTMNLVLVQPNRPDFYFEVCNGVTLQDRESQAMIARLVGRPDPGPVTLVVDPELIDRVYPPRQVLADEGEADLEGQPNFHPVVVYAAAGVCGRIPDVHRPVFDAAFPEHSRLLGGRVVLLCAPRIRQVGLVHDVGTTELAGRLVWMHEAIHWYRGASSLSGQAKAFEEAACQTLLATLLRTHPDGYRLRILMDALAVRQPAAYGTYRALVDAPLTPASNRPVRSVFGANRSPESIRKRK